MDGKLDWMAAGLPIEGTLAGSRVADVVREDVPVCRLDDPVSDARAKVEAGEWNFCVVVNEEGIVMGLLGADELDHDEDKKASEVMRAGPSTFRPHVHIAAMAHHMADHDLDTALITTSEGRLVGVLRREDALAIAQRHDDHDDEMERRQ